MAPRSLTTALTRALALFVVGTAAPAARGQATLVVGSIGDSISAGFNAQRLGDNRELSWSTGDHLNSVAQRLGAYYGRPVRAVNVSIAGSVSADIDGQVTRLVREAPEFVAVTIGANDVCSWGEDYADALAAFEATVTAQLRRILAGRPGTKIFLAPIPDLLLLREVALAEKPSCQQRWDVLRICDGALKGTATDMDRQRFAARWNAANDALAAVAAALGPDVFHDPEARFTRFEWRHVSPMDCFHPRAEGQELFAGVAWDMFRPE